MYCQFIIRVGRRPRQCSICRRGRRRVFDFVARALLRAKVAIIKLFSFDKMSLDTRNKKVFDTFEKYNIGDWGKGNVRQVSRFFLFYTINNLSF